MYRVNEDLSIYVTRGDTVSLKVTAKDYDRETDFTFPAGSVIRFKVFEKKACEKVVLSKDFPVEAATTQVNLSLEEKDTRIGGIISKPVDYWYEVELNPYDDPQTIIGYDENGPKVFKLFPEGKDIEDVETKPEDIPVVDAQLDMTSKRAVQNQVVAKKFAIVDNDISDNAKAIKAHIESKENPHEVTAEKLGALKKSGGIMTGPIEMDGHAVTGLPNAVNDTDALSLAFAKTLFAPSGYGLGKSSAVVSVADIDSVKNNGWYALIPAGKTLGGMNIEYGHMRVDKFGDDTVVQVIYPHAARGSILYRWIVSGVVTEEWENPPMVLGVEYRTTERWQGKVVYTKLVNCGNLPATGSETTVSHGANVTQIIQCYGQLLVNNYGGGDALPYDSKNYGEIVITASKSVIRIYTKSWIYSATSPANLTGAVILKYTKD